MKYNVEVGRTASQDINAAATYLAEQLRTPSAARHLLKNVFDCIDSLEQLPARCPVIDEPILEAQRLRMIPVHSYLLFYQIDEAAQTVHVLRFLYGKRNWVSILKTGFSAE